MDGYLGVSNEETWNRVNLCLYSGSSGELISLEMCMHSGNDKYYELDTRHCTISFIIEGRERLAHRLSLGPLDFMVGQIEHALDRLKKNEIAIIRSGVFDYSEGVFFIFEQLKDHPEEILVSIIEIDAPQIHYFYPREIQYRTGLLYRYVRANRDLLVSMASKEECYADLNQVHVKRDLLIKAFTRDFRLGTQLLPMVDKNHSDDQ